MPEAMTPATPTRDTHVYKVADGRGIEADVIGACAGGRKPAIVWIHGGGLIFSSRTMSPRAPFLRAPLERVFVIVSVDHRLAPETKLPDIVADAGNAWRWLHDGEGRALLPGLLAGYPDLFFAGNPEGVAGEAHHSLVRAANRTCVDAGGHAGVACR